MSNVASLLAAAAAKSPKTAPATKPAPQREQLVWENIDSASLPDDLRSAYHLMLSSRDAFQKAMIDKLEPPAHLTLAFSYKRGLAIALAPKASSRLTSFEALISRIPD